LWLWYSEFVFWQGWRFNLDNILVVMLEVMLHTHTHTHARTHTIHMHATYTHTSTHEHTHRSTSLWIRKGLFLISFFLLWEMWV
jgi:hypothetical protein